jgi:serine/threonine protein kinase
MAPEVIEMQPFITSACDVWSLGCTVFELLTGSPPNFELNQFSAMIKIVQEAGQMPLPDGVSPDLADFLNLCFKKNPAERPCATTLLEHRWLKHMSNESKIAKIMNLKLP